MQAIFQTGPLKFIKTSESDQFLNPTLHHNSGDFLPGTI